VLAGRSQRTPQGRGGSLLLERRRAVLVYEGVLTRGKEPEVIYFTILSLLVAPRLFCISGT